VTRTGLVVALLLALAVVAIASVVRVTGPGWSGMRDAAPVAAVSSGPLAVPVQGVARTTLVDSFADPRGNGARLHHAIDIAAAIGTPVVAVADGRIEKMFASARGGLTLYERSADGTTTYYYAHLAGYAPTLAEGAAVRAGQIVATVGASGDADPGAPHLHFEVHRMAPGERWWQGVEIDPYPLLRAAG
jgi:murein DD-endopeptidase MepM/ murein hydrolase activator NlpD